MEQIVLIHLSDIHFGANLINNTFGWIGGYRAHDPLLCVGFQQAMLDVRQLVGLRDDELMPMLVSGDQTAAGTVGEFSAANLYFHGERPVDFDFPMSTIGLKLPPSQLLKIPGNHDHWDGTRLPAGPYNAAIFGREFRSMPWRSNPLTSPQKQLALELIAVDSNSGMREKASLGDRLRARGRISDDEFSALKKRLCENASRKTLPAGAKIVRGIVTHHPLSINSRFQLIDAQPLAPASRAELLKIARNNDVFAILDGHTHRFYFEGFVASPQSSKARLWEMRCASTFQGPSKEANQGFLAHQIKLESDGVVTWNIWLYRWNGSRFGRPDGEPWLSLNVPPVLASGA